MAQVFHLIGLQGVGKTTLAVLMAQGFAALKGSVCMLQFGAGYAVRFDAVQGDFLEPGDVDEDPAQADVLFVEHLPDSFIGGKPGDTVIWMKRVPAAEQGAQAGQPGAADESAPAADGAQQGAQQQGAEDSARV